MFDSLQHQLLDLVRSMGDLGVFIAMFLESCIVPIPSEAIIIGAGMAGIPLKSITIYGSLGSTLGGIVGYYIGLLGAKPVILRFGKYIFITPHHLEQAEAFARKYGIQSVLIGRLVPVVPFKVFSIAAGITRLPLLPFAICTLIAVIPRIVLLSFYGNKLVEYTNETLLVTAGLLAVFGIYRLIRHLQKKKASSLQ
ncbi:MAG: DedA family protein [Candidatus Wallbacteria bacterium]|nr:DedA family protein [Candidatus Wallbacteria bacterium]